MSKPPYQRRPKPDFSHRAKPGQRKPDRPRPTTLQGDQPRAVTRMPDAANDLLYGIHAVAAALANPARHHVSLWTTENGLNRLLEEKVSPGIKAEIVHPRVLDHMLTGHDAVHQGAVLETRPLKQPRLDQVPRDGLIVLLDQVTDPHNVGAILRSCAAFAVSALVTTARHAPHETGVFFKAASGAYEHVPVTRVTNLSSAMEELRSYGFAIVGLDSEADGDISTVGKQRPLALVLGAEGKGLREKTRATCDQVVKLEMPGAIKSLNVSIATALGLYALSR